MFDLAIVGCGPVGAVAGNLAGRAGLSTVILERAPTIFELPRAIHFDAHIMRILHEAGVAHDVMPDLRVWKRSTFYGADSAPIRVHEWPAVRPYGWDAHYLFYQPTLEAVLRKGLDRYAQVDTRLSTEVAAVEQSEDHVTVVARDLNTGETSRVTARYLVGADGASSFVRNHEGVSLVDGAFDEPWLVVDLLCDRQLGRPDESEMFCNPARPSTRVPGPGRHHRWEFMLLPGESAEEMQRPDSVEALLAPWVRPDEVTVIRASVYRFHSLIARRWRNGRVFLAGDAAHQTPPFLGQGMCHGIRDVQNLVGKLTAVLAGGPSEVLLNAYESERRPHVEKIIEMAVASGREICVLDPVAAAERDERIRRAAASGDLPRTTFQGMPPLTGGALTATPGAGELFPQPRVTHLREPAELFDDVFAPQVVLVAHHSAAAEVRATADGLSVPLVQWASPGDEVTELAPGEGLVRDAHVCEWFDRHGSRCAIVRPDRYVYATSPTVQQAEAVLREACVLFPATSLASRR